WDPWPAVYQPQQAVFQMTPHPVDLTAATLRIDLHSAGKAGLGRFRLSVTNDPDAVEYAAARMNLKHSEVVSLCVALASAHARLGQFDEALSAIAQAIELTEDRAAKASLIAEAISLEGVPEALA